MKYIEYGYFGRTANVRDADLDEKAVDAFAAAIVALPKREKGSAEVLPFSRADKIARDA